MEEASIADIIVKVDEHQEIKSWNRRSLKNVNVHGLNEFTV